MIVRLETRDFFTQRLMGRTERKNKLSVTLNPVVYVLIKFHYYMPQNYVVTPAGFFL